MSNSTWRFILVGLAIISIGFGIITKSQVREGLSSVPSPSPTASASPYPSPSPVQDFQVNQVVVQLKPGASISDVNSRNGTTTVGQISASDYYVLSATAGAGSPASSAGQTSLPREPAVAAVSATPVPTTDSSTQQLRDQLAADPAVQDAGLNYFLGPSGPIMSFPGGQVVPGKSASDYVAQGQLLDQLLGLDDAQLRSRGAGKVVAVIDTGIDRTHPALASHLWVDNRINRDVPGDGIDNDHDGLLDDAYGWDFYSNDNDPTEVAADPATTIAGHGTFIAGLIALMAPDCRIMPIRVFSPLGVTDIFSVATCIRYATDHGADIINLSCGTPRDSSVMRDAVSYARQHNVLLFAAVGNSSTDQVPVYPANLTQDVQGVASIETNSVLSAFSNFGSSVSVDAFGHNLISTYPGGGYAMWSGTSFSTALATAQAALVLAAYPDPGPARTNIESTAVNIDALNASRQGELGKGRIAPLSALQSVSTNPAINPTIDLYAKVDLTNSGVQPAAMARAEISITGSVQQLRITGYDLSPTSVYSVVVDGNRLTSGNGDTSTVLGGFGLVFSTDPNAPLPLPSQQYPVSAIGHVEIHDARDVTVLSGDFVAPANGMPPQELIYKELRLSTLDGSAAPRGVASVEMCGTSQLLSISLEGLTGSTYSVVIDGQSIGTGTAHNGFIGLDNFSHWNLTLPSSLMPVVNISQIWILDSSGQPVYQGAFSFAGGAIGGH